MARAELKRPAPGRIVRGGSEEPCTIRLDGADLAYVLRRSARRSMALQVDSRGVRVAVPWQARADQVEGFIRQHAQWLLARLAAQSRDRPSGRVPVADGAEIPVFGERCRVRLGAGGRSARWRFAADGVEELVLPGAGDSQRALLAALRRRALPWFAERVEEFCFRLGRTAPPVRLSSARTRWGSCSALSGIRLHWRLVHLPPELIDYVVAHEVAHLVEMNHSPSFWSVVASLYPDWKQARARLREAGRGLPVIGCVGEREVIPHED